MSNLFSPGLQASSQFKIRKRRELPLAGETLVRAGDRVSADQIIARAHLDGELRIIRIAEQLGIGPDEVNEALRADIGQHVEPGQLLAEMRGMWGLFRSTVVAPAAGTVEFLSAATGHLGLRAAPKLLNLCAYVGGTVTAVEEGRAITIESEATFVQGIFGVGGERMGRLKVLDVPPDQVVDESHIPPDIAGLVLVGGHSPTAAALARASQSGAVGFVTGSISGTTIKEYLGYDIGIALTGDEQVSMTLIVTEGFGAIGMSERVLRTLKRVDGEQASINGATQVRAGAQRPEIIAPARPGSVERPAAPRGLEIGAQVRIIRVPWFGSMGTVVELPHALHTIETGASTRVLKVALSDGPTVIVPRANVELLD